MTRSGRATQGPVAEVGFVPGRWPRHGLSSHFSCRVGPESTARLRSMSSHRRPLLGPVGECRLHVGVAKEGGREEPWPGWRLRKGGAGSRHRIEERRRIHGAVVGKREEHGRLLASASGEEALTGGEASSVVHASGATREGERWGRRESGRQAMVSAL